MRNTILQIGFFLDSGGFSVWFAYSLTKRATKGAFHFDGQAACNQMLKAIDETLVEKRQVLAREVENSIPDTAQIKSQEVYNKTIKPIQADLPAGGTKKRCKSSISKLR